MTFHAVVVFTLLGYDFLYESVLGHYVFIIRRVENLCMTHLFHLMRLHGLHSLSFHKGPVIIRFSNTFFGIYIFVDSDPQGTPFHGFDLGFHVFFDPWFLPYCCFISSSSYEF